MNHCLHWKNNISSKGSISPSSREGHSLTFIKPLRSLAMFGGCSNNKSNQLFMFSLDENCWTKQEYRGISPSPRCYHSAVYNQKLNALIIIGGYTSLNVSANDIYFLLIDSWTFKAYKPIDTFPKRHHFSLVNHQDYLVIFGGVSRPQQIYYNDTLNIKLNNMVFTADHHIQNLSVVDLVTSGRAPTPRYGHQTLLILNKMYVFGGYIAAPHTQRDDNIYFLDLTTRVWNKFQPILSAVMCNRAFSMVMKLPQDRILVFGGQSCSTDYAIDKVCLLDFNSQIWSVPLVGGVMPQSRRHSSYAQVDQELYIIGGICQKYCAMQLLSLQYCEYDVSEPWQNVVQPTVLQIKAANVLRGRIVDNHQNILTLEWAIREELKIAKLFREIDNNMKLKKEQKKQSQAEQKLRLAREAEQHRQKQSEFIKCEENKKQFLKLEQQHCQILKQSIGIQQQHIAGVMDYIQYVQTAAMKKRQPEIETPIRDFQSRIQEMIKFVKLWNRVFQSVSDHGQ